MQRLRDLEAVGVLENLTPNKEGVPQFPKVSILEPAMEAHSQDDEQLPALQNNVELLDLTRLPILGEYR